jgi:hypothetical protein
VGQGDSVGRGEGGLIRRSTAMNAPSPAGSRTWPAEGLTRVPYWVYQDEELYHSEQERVFRGETWNFLCLEAELPGARTSRSTFVGDTRVIVTRDANGVLEAFERPKPESQAPGKLRVATFCGLVFATLSDTTPAVEEYLGPEILPRIRRVMQEPIRVIGGYTQALPNNWKLYAENVRDTYHGSLLHSFYTTFRISRLSQRGGVIVGSGGTSHATFVMIDKSDRSDDYERAGVRAVREGFSLEAPEVLEEVDELGDGIAIQILTVFPGFVLQQVHNSLAVRLIGPAGYVSMEDGAATGFVQRGVAGAPDRASVVEMGGATVGTQESRLSETSVRGFWQVWRRLMDL